MRMQEEEHAVEEYEHEGVTGGGAHGGGGGGQGGPALPGRRLAEEPARLGADLVLPQPVRLGGRRSRPLTPMTRQSWPVPPLLGSPSCQLPYFPAGVAPPVKKVSPPGLIHVQVPSASMSFAPRYVSFSVPSIANTKSWSHSDSMLAR